MQGERGTPGSMGNPGENGPQGKCLYYKQLLQKYYVIL